MGLPARAGDVKPILRHRMRTQEGTHAHGSRSAQTRSQTLAPHCVTVSHPQPPPNHKRLPNLTHHLEPQSLWLSSVTAPSIPSRNPLQRIDGHPQPFSPSRQRRSWAPAPSNHSPPDPSSARRWRPLGRHQPYQPCAGGETVCETVHIINPASPKSGGTSSVTNLTLAALNDRRRHPKSS